MLKFRGLKGRSLQPLLLVMLMVGALTFSFTPTSTPDVAEAAPGDVRITGIVDGDLSGGNPKAIELYVEGTVDLSSWTLWRSSNGGAFDSSTALNGTYTDEFVYLIGTANGGLAAFDSVFGTSGDFANRALESSIVSGNGDDGFQIRNGSGTVIDQVWLEDTNDVYLDSYMYRNDCTGPDRGWVPANWTIPGNSVLDGLDAAGHTAAVPFGTWTCGDRAPVINEFVFDNSATPSDLEEFVEIFGAASSDLSAYTILGIEGDGSGAGVIDNVFSVGTTDANGYWRTAFGSNVLENGTLTLLLVEGFTGIAGNDLDTNNDGVLDSTPWTRIVDDVAVTDGGSTDQAYSTTVLRSLFDGIVFRVGGASRFPNGIDTDNTSDWLRNDFNGEGLSFGSVGTATRIEAVNTPGAENLRGTADAAPVVVSTSPARGEAGVAVNSNIVINFSEPVSFTTSSATLECNAAPVAFTVSGTDPVTINPSVDFNTSDSCVVTLLSANITDIDLPTSLTLDGDGDGNPETPDNYSFNFTVTGPVAPTRIYDLQENGSQFGISGPFTVEGIVTNDLEATLTGFYMQDATGDGIPATSDGIFVYDPSTGVDVNVGEVVQVTGTVSEFFGQTQITATAIVKNGTGTITPTVVTLPIPSVNDWENFEGMLITLAPSGGDQLTATDVFNLGKFGEVTVSSGRLFNPTNVYLPGSSQETALRDENARNKIIVDDLSDGNIDLFTPGNVPYIPTTSSEMRAGFTTTDITGTLGYGFSNYRIRPTSTPVWSNTNPRTPAPNVPGQLIVASFNVENWFNGNGIGGGFPTERGANTLVEFDRQRDKIVSSICQIDADILGLVELENEADASNISAVETLVQEINLSCGLNYSIIQFGDGVIGSDAIKVGIIYKADVVTPVGNPEILTEADDARFNTSKNRPALAQTFDDNFGGRFTLVVNHFKSKGSSCGDTGIPGDDDALQGNCNLTRTNAAEALADWLATDPTGSGDPDFLIVGDLNAYAQEDPIRALEEGADDVPGNGDDYVDLIEQFIGPGDVGYSYVFFGEAGYLDHVMANNSLLSQVTGVAEWHTNADEPNQRGYDDAIRDPEFSSGNERDSELYPEYLYEPNPYRSSDHDPVIVGLSLSRDVEPNDGTIFQIGDWTDNAGALCSNDPLAALVIPFDGTSFSVTHVVQPTGGSYAFEIPGGIAPSPISTAGAGGFATQTGSTTNPGRNFARIEPQGNGEVCIDSFTAVPSTPVSGGAALATSTGQPSGATQALRGCSNSVILHNLQPNTASSQYEYSLVIIGNDGVNPDGVMLSMRFTFITPPFLTNFRVGIPYFSPVADPAVPGYSPAANAGNPLNPTDTTQVLFQIRDNSNASCQSMSIDWTCGTNTAIVTQNLDTCIFN